MCLIGPNLAIFLKRDRKVSLKKVQDPLKSLRLINCSLSEPWHLPLPVPAADPSCQETASPAAAGSLLGTKSRLEHEAGFIS